MTAYVKSVGKIRDRGYRVFYDSKDIVGINSTDIYTRSPQMFDHFLDSNTIRSTGWVATETGVGTSHAAFVATAAADGGTAVGIAGATTNNSQEMGWALAQFKPSTMAKNRPLNMECRVKHGAATNNDTFFGLHKINTATGTA